MPGYNHYPWCVCGWCYKTGSNGYSQKRIVVDFDKSYAKRKLFDKSYAKRKLEKHGADRSWTACFVVSNATCPKCSAKVYYYQNEHGSRVFFDELGWPWPKHPCTDNARTTVRVRGNSFESFVDRKRGEVAELLETAKTAEFDPNAKFRSKYGHSPFDLLKVLETARRGFENFVKAQSISPPLDDPVFLAFTSAKVIPAIGDYFSYSGEEVCFMNQETFVSQSFKTKSITAEELAAVGARERP